MSELGDRNRYCIGKYEMSYLYIPLNVYIPFDLNRRILYQILH